VGRNQSGGRMPRQSVMAVGVALPVTKDMGEEGDFRCAHCAWHSLASCIACMHAAALIFPPSLGSSD